jgi:FkbM family methyltransferase
VSDGAAERIAALAAILRHPDPSQLAFQVAEIAGERCYERHGVRVEPGATVLDVGANFGVAAAYFLTQLRAGRVHCFEPVAPNYEILLGNVGELPGCVPHPYGLSSRAGRSAITYYPGAAAMSGLYGDPERDRALVRTALANLGVSGAEADAEVGDRFEPQTLECELRTLSGFLSEEGIERVDLLKVDVERAELDVLGGIGERDWPRIRRLVVEVHDEDGRLRRLCGDLEARGYGVASEQDRAMRGTDIHLVYATREP